MSITIIGSGIQGPPAFSYDVKRFGATGDGVTDDTEAFEDAIAAASGASGIVWIPEGEYVLTTLSSTVSMQGSGDATVLLISDFLYLGADTALEDVRVVSSFDYGISVSSQENVTIKNCKIESTAASIVEGYTNGILVYNSPNVQILNCRFNYAGIEYSLSDRFLVDGCYWDCEYLNIGEPCHISASSRGQFVNNTVYRSTSDCLDLYTDGGYCVVTNNRFLSPRLTGSNGAVVEVKVTFSDDVDNTSETPEPMQQCTIIANNVIRDAQITSGSGTRVGISAFYLDSRSVPSWDQNQSAPGMVIANNVISDLQTTENVTVSWNGIAFTGHNSVISGNVIRNLKAWSSTAQYGIVMSEANASGPTLGIYCVGVQVANNIITGIDGNPGRAFYVGNLKDCLFTGNITRPDEHSTLTTAGKYGFSIANSSTLSGVRITGNVFDLPMSSSYAIHDGNTTTVMDDCAIVNNRIINCGVQIRQFNRLIISKNNYTNSTTSNGWTLGDVAAGSTALTITDNICLMNNNNCFILDTIDRFLCSGNQFVTVLRPFYAFRVTTNGVVTNTISKTQGTGAAVLLFDASVSAPNQATTYLSAAGDNKIVA